MKVLFAIGNGYPPEFHGGVQSSTHHLVEQLKANGHEASVLAALFGDGIFGLTARIKMKVLGQSAVIDTYAGYPVIRSWFPWQEMSYAVARTKPDVAVVQCHKSVPLAKALQELGVPVVVYLRNVEFHELAGDLRDLHPATYISNSEFTARSYSKSFGITSTVIPPSIDASKYATVSSREYITFINPCDKKGLVRVVEIARSCPEIPFLFVESWKLSEQEVEIKKIIASLRNVTLVPRTDDMKSVYGRTKILLAPSKWEEAWGRVASEAHCSGIPVIGSRRGGLPEAIGKGGLVLDYDAPLEDWVGAVRRLWSNNEQYRQFSADALAFSRRPALQLERQFAIFFEILEKAYALQRSPQLPDNRGGATLAVP